MYALYSQVFFFNDFKNSVFIRPKIFDLQKEILQFYNSHFQSILSAFVSTIFFVKKLFFSHSKNKSFCGFLHYFVDLPHIFDILCFKRILTPPTHHSHVFFFCIKYPSKITKIVFVSITHQRNCFWKSLVNKRALKNYNRGPKLEPCGTIPELWSFSIVCIIFVDFYPEILYFTLWELFNSIIFVYTLPSSFFPSNFVFVSIIHHSNNFWKSLVSKRELQQGTRDPN